MRTFTRMILVAAFAVSHLAAYSVMADGRLKEAGVIPPNAGGSSAWKAVPEKKAEANVRAENARTASWVKNYTANKNRGLYLTETAYAGSSQFVISSYMAFMPAPERQTPSINAYPNPSRGITRVSLSQVGMTENYKLKISNTIGKVMETHELPVTHSNVFILDMTGYPAGVYFYSLLVNDKTVETKRLILQK
ncbi:T9SS type A sorting domain-containing protein [Pontibacter virosus]|uniref:Putative secreted protein (Por secretion system target) n=1 Tax=Pontibacter virosus TaxID=1765052 RepID=A0A2U1B523_9BACT|nr:T9SS type A sorting domain-containing protein [Pontibacter virosus]PVY43786.1 putative secreted protein (Por secretion system target) [Pontibacter virosus]